MSAIFGFSGPPDATLLSKMGQVLSHRGAQPARSNESPRGTIAFRAHSFDDSAGLYSEGDQSIALAGHLTEPPEDGRSLKQLLDLYRTHGPRFVSRLSGAFVLAIQDGTTIHLARDGAGVRTIYYGRHAGRFLFAIEPKGVLAAPSFPRRIRPAAVAQYLTFSFTPGAGTILEDLFELPAGHTVTCQAGEEPTLQRYFVFEHPEQCDARPDEHWVSRFRDMFRHAVAERLPRTEPIGVFLSGGLDSSVVAAEVARQADRPVKSYAIHFGEEYPHELDFARMVAERCGTDHEEVLIRPRGFLPRLRKMVWHLDEPIGDPITMPNFELSAHVARDTKWVFNGEGGDPCFGGPKNIPMLLQHWYGGIQRDDRFREQSYLASYRRGYEEVSRLLTPEFRKQIDVRADLEGVLTPYFNGHSPKNFLDKLTNINIRLKGAHLILPKVERMTGAWGIVPLAPLFDEDLVRLSFEMPPTLKLRGGVEKVVIKRAYENALPRPVIDRPKSGMRVPVHYWFRGEMKRYARKILSRRNLRNAGIFDERRVRQLLNYDIEEGPGRYGLRLWMLITFEIWRRLVVEGESL